MQCLLKPAGELSKKMKGYGARFLKKNTYRGNPFWMRIIIHIGWSSTWSSVIHGAKFLRSGITWRVGNGGSINFWNDNCTGLGALYPLALNADVVDNPAMVRAGLLVY